VGRGVRCVDEKEKGDEKRRGRMKREEKKKKEYHC
jgi:hypothetical protein